MADLAMSWAAWWRHDAIAPAEPPRARPQWFGAVPPPHGTQGG